MQPISAFFAVVGILLGIGIAANKESKVHGFTAAIIIGYLVGAYLGMAIAELITWLKNRRLNRHR